MRKAGLGAMVYLALGALVWAVLALGTFKGLHDPDSMDFCDIGRNLARGKGFVTDHIQPLSYALQPVLEPGHPDLMRPPLPAFLLALLFLAGGQNDAAALALPYLCYLGALGLFWMYSGTRLRGGLRLLACALFALNPLLLQHSLIPSSELPFTVLMLAVFVGGLDSNKPFRSGALFGLAYLARNNGLIYFATVLLFWIGTGVRKSVMGRAIAGFCLVTSPWLVRTAILTGNPFYTLHGYIFVEYTRTYPAYSVYEHFLRESAPALFLRFCLEKPLELLDKIQANLITQSRAFAALAGHLLAAGYLLFPWLKRRELGPASLTYALVAVHLGFMVLASGPEPDFQRFLLPFLAPVLILGLQSLSALVGKVQGPRKKAWAWGLAAAVVLQLASRAALLLRPEPGLPRGWYRQASRIWGPGEILLTDIPWCTAWYGEVRGLRLPEDWTTVENNFPSERIGAIYLSPVLLTQPLRQYWKSVYFGGSPPAGFVLEKTFPDGSKYFVREERREVSGG